MTEGLTLQEFVNLLQQEIDKGNVSGDLPVAVRSALTPQAYYWLLSKDNCSVEEFEETAVILY